MKLGGQEIYDYLEFSSAIWFDQMQSENDHMIKFRKDENGEVLISDNGRAKLQNAYYNFDNAEGLIYTVDLRQPKGKRVTIVSLGDGSPFDFNRTYSVAVNSYRGNGGGGHLTAGAKIRQELLADRILQNTNNDFRYHLMAWIKANDVIDPTVNYNWKILPETWVEKSRNQDRELLFGD
jgi:2',3'-cyclic-nucleotide 2'-phosphodiesterase/3'-nucleotidase